MSVFLGFLVKKNKKLFKVLLKVSQIMSKFVSSILKMCSAFSLDHRI